MPTTPRILTVSQAADELGVAPARIRALLASGALRSVPDQEGSVSSVDIDALARRGVVRAVDVAAVEGALDRALRRRLPEIVSGRLEQALSPLASELATAFADVELGSVRLAAAEERARSAEQALSRAQERIRVLEATTAALAAQPSGLFRRRRSVATA